MKQIDVLKFVHYAFRSTETPMQDILQKVLHAQLDFVFLLLTGAL
jgi:hypothetical protein